MTPSNVTAEELAALVERTAQAASVHMRGDMRKYVELIAHADDCTFDGAVRRRADDDE